MKNTNTFIKRFGGDEMAILEKEVVIGIGNKIKHYEQLNYDIPKYMDKNGKFKLKKGTKILVKVDDLPIGSGVKVTKVCDECGERVEPKQSYSVILQQRENGDGKDRCKKCGQKYGRSNFKKNISYERSLEFFAINSNKTHLLSEFSIKNNKLPKDIYKSTKDEIIWDCLECKSEYKMSVDSRTSKNRGCNCPYCAGKRVNETNCLWTTHPEIAKLLEDEGMGYKITAQSNKKENFICGRCGYMLKNKFIYQIVNQGFNCPKCSDGISYPEKFMFNVLDQLNLIFDTQKVFEWSKNIEIENKELSGIRKYDFYIPSLNCIIETHGRQHYEGGFENLSGKSLKEEADNDRFKKMLAKANGIENYIVIDCKESKLEYIKNNIINSELRNFVDINNEMDWVKCHEFACNSLVKVACDLWNSGVKSTLKIGKHLNLHLSTVVKYLKQGAEIGWCDYDPKETQKNNGYSRIGKKNSKKWGKSVVRLDLDGKFIDYFISATDAGRLLNITSSHISGTCNGKRKSAGGYKWIFKDDYLKVINHT